jgi:putative addiction module killer protein
VRYDLPKDAQEKEIIAYSDKNGTEPFSDWLYSLKDTMVRKRILVRIERLAHGNYGDCEAVGEGVSELRMFFGSGYRVYFAEKGSKLVILLCGGDKKTQAKDIKNAKRYWKEYLK